MRIIISINSHTLKEIQMENVNHFKAYVHKETTLGVLYPNNLMGVLSGKPQFGGKQFPDEPFTVSLEDIRPATQKDFEYFRVQFHPDYI